MEIEVYGKSHKKKNHRKEHIYILIAGIFSLILFFLIYTSFYGDISFNGSTILNNIKILNKSNNIQLSAKLTVPLLELNGKFKKIEISGSSDSYLYVGNQKFYLGNIKGNYLIFYNYDGKIYFNSGKILKLNGESSGVSINGILISSQSKKTTKINLNNSLDYKSLKISKGVSIDKLSYKTLGMLKLNNEKEIFNIDNEKVALNNFYGNLSVENKELYLQGYVKGVGVTGNLNIHIQK